MRLRTSHIQVPQPGARSAFQLRLVGGALFVVSLLPALLGLAVSPVAMATESRRADTALRFENEHRRIADRYGQLQLVVTASSPDGTTRDVTDRVAYEVSPSTVVDVDAAGRVLPLSAGEATIVARDAGGRTATIQVVVEEFSRKPPEFEDRVMPILSKYGCNTCHGKPGGRNGFQLSLFGHDPAGDFEAIVLQARGRRVSTAAPEQSLLLRKATQEIPHGGGFRFDRRASAYRVVRDWIAAGVPRGSTPGRKVERIEVLPRHATLEPDGRQQIAVVAAFSDGSRADVTHAAIFRTNDNTLAEVDERGVVTAQGNRGEFAVVALYGGQVAVFRGAVPFGHRVDDLPPPRNLVDEAVFAKWRSLGIPPSPPSDDGAFLRRVTIDLAGRLPTLEETRAFLADRSADKRDRCIDRLLESTDYADYFANKWVLLLRNLQGGPESRRGTFSFHLWVRESLRENKPYDQFVREIITASGDVGRHPPANWYRELRDVESRVENMSQVFLGVRITCARCHHHPYEKWSQKDYYSLAAFFSRMDKKRTLHGNPFYYEQRIYHKRGVPFYTHPRTGEKLKPAGLGGPPLDVEPDDDPRQKLVDWMVEPNNPFFATALVNRYWKHFFGRGIVDPEDDLRDTNPPSNAMLLESLRRHFIESGYDMKELVRTICRSRVYQLSCEATELNIDDTRCFSWFYPRRLNAEVLLDATDQLLGTQTRFSQFPADVRAVQLPDTATSSRHEMLELFGQPKSQTPCECERTQAGDLRQSLYMLTSSQIMSKLSAPQGFASRYAGEKERSIESIVDEIYLRAFCRPPSETELAIAADYVRRHPNRKRAFEDLLWSIARTKEFLYNH